MHTKTLCKSENYLFFLRKWLKVYNNKMYTSDLCLNLGCSILSLLSAVENK